MKNQIVLCIRQWWILEKLTEKIRVIFKILYFLGEIYAFYQEKKAVQIKGQICHFLLELSKFFIGAAEHLCFNFGVTHNIILESVSKKAFTLEPRYFQNNENKWLQSVSASSKENRL